MEEDNKLFSLSHVSISGRSSSNGWFYRVVVLEDGSFLSLRCCKADNLRCDRESCEIISPLGVVMVCCRMRRSRRGCFTKAKSGAGV